MNIYTSLHNVKSVVATTTQKPGNTTGWTEIRITTEDGSMLELCLHFRSQVEYDFSAVCTTPVGVVVS